MWDNNTPLQLIKTMPKKLNQDNLAKIQLVIDVDKYKNSLVSGFDLCGIYAPFCRGCDKTSIYPCAIAYIRMLQSEGMKIQIDASPLNGGDPEPYQPAVEIPKSEPVVVSEPRMPRPRVKVDRRPYESKYQPPVAEAVAEAAATRHEPAPQAPAPVIEEPVYRAPAPVKVEPPVEKITVEEKPVAVKPVEVKPVEVNPVEVKPVIEDKVLVAETPVAEPVKPQEEEVKTAYEPPVEQSKNTAKPEKKKIRIAVARRKL